MKILIDFITIDDQMNSVGMSVGLGCFPYSLNIESQLHVSMRKSKAKRCPRNSMSCETIKRAQQTLFSDFLSYFNGVRTIGSGV